MNQLFDPGVQAERTALAWRRTSLALLTGSLVAIRILPELLGPWPALAGLAGAVWSGILLTMAQRRYRQHCLRFRRHADRFPLAGGRLVAALAALAFAVAIVSIGLVLVAAATHSLHELEVLRT